MAYFKLSLPEQINTYGFDYHSHFSGILPVRGKDARDARPSLQRLVAQYECDGDEDLAALRLFGHALAFMADPASNPFNRLARAASQAVYERAECAAENIYVACILLLDAHGVPLPAQPWAIGEAALYRATHSTVVLPALDRGTPVDPGLLKAVRYFNGKIYSSNKYTPFDDCYKTRGAFLKSFCGGDPADYAQWKSTAAKPGDAAAAAAKAIQRYEAWIGATLDYLKASGIANTQTAIGEDEMAALDPLVHAYNARNKCSYKLLVHTPHHYMRAGELGRYLKGKVLPMLAGQGYDEVIGLDLLGAENKVGNYGELFEFLAANQAALAANFGEDKRSRRLVAHIHCGEGSGFGADNRSLTGYCMFRAGGAGPAWFDRFSRYIIACARAARARQADVPRGTRGTATPYGLFDLLFGGGNALTHDGQPLHRFDISAPGSREQAAYNAKRNVMALAETLSSRPAGNGHATWYDRLTGDGSPFALRLGHDYYYRSYVAARFPLVAFDTNVGSNAITGASGLFASVESYRINRGFRHLNGYIDTGVLQAASDAVAYLGTEALTSRQAAEFSRISAQGGRIYEVLDEPGNREWICAQIRDALGPLYAYSSKEHDLWYRFYQNMVGLVIADDSLPPQRYQALTRAFALFQNWRSCLLGADGQGAEHTQVQDEFLRMLVLLAYALLPAGIVAVEARLLTTLGNFVEEVARAYWLDTIGHGSFPESTRQPLELESIDGFKAPASVVALYRRPIVDPAV